MGIRYLQTVIGVIAVRRILCGLELELGSSLHELMRVEVIRDDVMRAMVSRNLTVNERVSRVGLDLQPDNGRCGRCRWL